MVKGKNGDVNYFFKLPFVLNVSGSILYIYKLFWRAGLAWCLSGVHVRRGVCVFLLSGFFDLLKNNSFSHCVWFFWFQPIRSLKKQSEIYAAAFSHYNGMQ